MSDNQEGVVNALATLLSKDSARSRDEPEIAANIGAQLAHMEIKSWPISIRRRVRDIVGRLQPKRVCEVGAGIGHLSAWLMDMWEDEPHPLSYQLVEAGGKFGVILYRLLERYSARGWAEVKVGRFEQLVAEQKAWEAANTSSVGNIALSDAREPILATPFDCIVVDVDIQSLVVCLKSALASISPGGIILTVEPEVPTGDFDDDDEVGQSVVEGFQKWIDFIHAVSSENDLAFQPVYGGTIVAIHCK